MDSSTPFEAAAAAITRTKNTMAAAAEALAEKEFYNEASMEEDESEEKPIQQQQASPATNNTHPAMDPIYYQLMRHGSSFAKNDDDLRKAGFKKPVTGNEVWFSRKSKRIAAIFRLMRQLATVTVSAASYDPNDQSIGTTSIKDIFRFVRCQVRYGDTLMKDDPAMDAQAEIADSEQDKLMINCIEDCALKVGYVILRALAAIREYGSPKAKVSRNRYENRYEIRRKS